MTTQSYICDHQVTFMPKQTFYNLKAEKRKRITNAFLREFAVQSYDDASLTDVVHELGIAKGSMYQYFEDKLDLYLYLIQEATAVKMQYVGAVQREDHPDYWSFYKTLFEQGFQFDRDEPLYSHFLHNLGENLNSPSVKHLYDDMMQQAVAAFEEMVKYEIKAGHFRKDISIPSMAFTLYKLGVSIQEQFRFSGLIKPQKSIQKQTAVYQNKTKKLLRMIDEHIQLIRPAFDK